MSRPRPVLAPGVRVLQRGDGQLQVGLDPRRAVVLPDSESCRQTLRVLTHAEPAELADSRLLDSLADRGLVLDAARRPPGLPATALLTFGGGPPPGLVGLCARAGLPLVEPHEAHALVLVAGCGEPDRELLDPLMREEMPHLVVRMSEGEAVLGPFVDPGRTACLRCVDAHHTDADRRWPLLVVQQSRRGEQPDEIDVALAALGCGWAVRDLVTHARGGRPATTSTTVRIPPDLTGLESVTWLRHPRCGCGWATPSQWGA